MTTTPPSSWAGPDSQASQSTPDECSENDIDRQAPEDFDSYATDTNVGK